MEQMASSGMKSPLACSLETERDTKSAPAAPMLQTPEPSSMDETFNRTFGVLSTVGAKRPCCTHDPDHHCHMYIPRILPLGSVEAAAAGTSNRGHGVDSWMVTAKKRSFWTPPVLFVLGCVLFTALAVACNFRLGEPELPVMKKDEVVTVELPVGLPSKWKPSLSMSVTGVDGPHFVGKLEKLDECFVTVMDDKGDVHPAIKPPGDDEVVYMLSDEDTD